ncbi:polysaccharide pyruvyl transferase family protein [Blastococcus sp. VKM Ac-2987]|uniref:polysaccharide pyruvyl transferase family protein n=1 Tax=Blastococcus sp. VKM Ac-2987 TaxID=3004141 RepID=UPI0022AB6378|nr:polysaccharide pyruvyl transferase family protein [Blastococcus sp. VKM Ac-2987]MCZ2858495.1 polysaccharide pyruvyl transferase family protein [Blastococcus sp. VKM Ac-2987]
MRVLVENGEYWLNNKGDQAMLDVSVGRCTERWPGARIGVLTSAPRLLQAYEPAAEPIWYERGGAWNGRGPVGLPGVADLLDRLGPSRTGPVLNGWDAVVARTARIHRGSSPPPPRAERVLHRDGGTLPDALAEASGVIAIGGGYLTDVDRSQTARTLDLLEYATARRIPTAMLGQGIGPLEDGDLRERAARVLPAVGLIALREGLRGPAVLRGLGVRDDRIVVTGDDAVELGYGLRPDRLGAAIGVCLRIADYSPVGSATRAAVGRGLRAAAREHRAALAPVIVSEHGAEDRRATLPLVEEALDVLPPPGRFAPARELIRRVGECRVMVTGAYHAAVFAMSQGIPVVALSSSQYYDDKFEGLADMFGCGLDLVRLAADDDSVAERLLGAVSGRWRAAPDQRAALLESASHQVGLSRAAFDQAATLLEGGAA